MSSSVDRDPAAEPTDLAARESFEAFAEELFADATLLAMRVCDAPMAALTLVRKGHHWFKSRGGVGLAETPEAIALCARAMEEPESLILPDVRADRGARAPGLARSGIRFFAGIPLRGEDGGSLGALAVLDHEPRALEPDRVSALHAVGRQIQKWLALRLRGEGLDETLGSLGREARRLKKAHEWNAAVFDSAAPGIVVFDRAQRVVGWNRSLEGLTGVPAADARGRPAAASLPHLAEPGAGEWIERVLAGDSVTVPDFLSAPGGAGGPVWVSAQYSALRDASGAVAGVVGVLQNVASRRRAEAASREAQGAFRPIVEHLPVGLYVIADERFRYVNARLAALLGYSEAELLVMDSVLQIVAPDDRDAARELLRRRLAGEAPAGRELVRAVRRDGKPIEIEDYGALVEIDGEPALVGAMLDVTDRRRNEARIAERAYLDPLTRLPNRARLLERLERELAQSRRHGRRLAVVYLDVDRFKLINDTRGHAAGDRLLQALALRLQRRLRQTDLVARVGGDEFVILMPDAKPPAEMSLVAHKLLLDIARPFELPDDQNLAVTASVGIATFPEDGEDAEALLHNADTAMYRAKELGRNNFQLCTPELTSRAMERLALQSGLRAALDRREFILNYQPMVSLATGRVVALEALVRWERPDKGLVMPSVFIPTAEETGLIVPLGEWVLREACRQLAIWRKKGFPDLRVAVNVSARQFREENLLPAVGEALQQAELDPRQLEVEITESIAMESAEIVVGNLRMLRGMGVGIAIDDFGMGYSSMSYLKRYPVTALKIDRSFVTDLPRSAADAGIVRAIVEMAHGTKLEVVAEGVETHDQFRCLQQFGCDLMQGNWVAPPLTAGGVDHLLEEELQLWSSGG
jgi:diguanylate cyclase (GGDEF)-like protein/PAS domain S-box-containing protein